MTKRERKYVVMKVCETCLLTLGLLSMFYMGRAISLIEEGNSQAAAGGSFFGAGNRMMPPPPQAQNHFFQSHDDQQRQKNDRIPATTTQASHGWSERGSSTHEMPPFFHNEDEEWQHLERMASGSIPKPRPPFGSSSVLMPFRPGFLRSTSTASSSAQRPPLRPALYAATSSRNQAVVGVHTFRNAYRIGGEYPVVQWMSRVEGKVEVSMHKFNAPLASPVATRATTTYAYVGNNWAVLLPQAATASQETTGMYVIILKSDKMNPKTGEPIILGVSQPFRYQAEIAADSYDSRDSRDKDIP